MGLENTAEFTYSQSFDNKGAYPVNFAYVPNVYENSYAIYNSEMAESICIKKDGRYIVSYNVGWQGQINAAVTAYVVINDYIPIPLSMSEEQSAGEKISFNQQIFSVYLRHSDCIEIQVMAGELPNDQRIKIMPNHASFILEN